MNKVGFKSLWKRMHIHAIPISEKDEQDLLIVFAVPLMISVLWRSVVVVCCRYIL